MYSFISKYFDSINNHVIKSYISHNQIFVLIYQNTNIMKISTS